MTFKQLIAVTVAVVIALTVLDSVEADTVASASEVQYSEMHQVVSGVTHALTSQYCKHGATLILIGKYEQAKQYDEDFGQCMRNIVQKVNLGR